ncbi:hypothetical protein J6590_036967 [Homalodisca vitripennis]|nr:hypothetical protein J6590_036967 [Homalodisca vitripennis]
MIEIPPKRITGSKVPRHNGYSRTDYTLVHPNSTQPQHSLVRDTANNRIASLRLARFPAQPCQRHRQQSDSGYSQRLTQTLCSLLTHSLRLARFPAHPCQRHRQQSERGYNHRMTQTLC